VAASNADLRQLVRWGEFRADLYYRLDVISFHLQPLRERVQDIAPLARDLVARYATQSGKGLLDLSPEALAVLEAYPWPGNLRELDNVIRQAVLLSRGPALLPRHLPEWVRKPASVAEFSAAAAGTSLRGDREAMERGLIRRALADHGHSRARAAEELGISRVTLYKKMKKYGLVLARG
jgi:transcriptional regulator with PAS, ATPase and Fis domain